MAEPRYKETTETEEPQISISHFVHTIRAYIPVISLSLGAVALASVIVVILLYSLAPSQVITSQPFRLNFDGAADGRYPNGLRFSSGEIVGTPIVLSVFKEDHLDRFTTFSEFSRSV